jgi:hypothetical protein
MVGGSAHGWLRLATVSGRFTGHVALRRCRFRSEQRALWLRSQDRLLLLEALRCEGSSLGLLRWSWWLWSTAWLLSGGGSRHFQLHFGVGGRPSQLRLSGNAVFRSYFGAVEREGRARDGGRSVSALHSPAHSASARCVAVQHICVGSVSAGRLVDAFRRSSQRSPGESKRKANGLTVWSLEDRPVEAATLRCSSQSGRKS